MDLINSLQNGQRVQIASKTDFVINLGDGHSNINIKAKNVAIDTGCGDQNITANVTENLSIDTGHCGYDTINAITGGSAYIVTREDDDEVTLLCNGNFDIDAGEDHHECEDRGYTYTDNDTVTVYSNSSASQNKISTGKDNDKITVVAHNVEINKGEGTMLLGALGNNYEVNSKASQNTIGFYGDNYDINVTADRSKNDIRTMDFWIRDGQDGKKIELNDSSTISLKDAVDDVQETHNGKKMTLTEYDAKNNAENVKYFKDTFGTLFDKYTYAGQKVTTEVSTDFVNHESVTTNNKDEIVAKYNLSASEKAILDNVDLTKTLSNDGKPLYAIAKSPKKGVYVVVKRDGTNHSRAVSDNECIAFYASETSSYKQTTTNTDTYKVTTTNIIEDLFATTGIKNISITQRNGQLNSFLSVSEGYATINKGGNCNNEQIDNINIIGGHIDSKVTKVSTNENDVKVSEENYTGDILISNGKTWTSPLILDINKDGKVSSSNGEGVDIDNDGKADGAATRGDKMLAMSDINENGKIDGNEVFGDQTISPFTGEKLNAKNGFEALKMIAQEAEQKTGKKIINNGEVDIAELKAALATVGINLGLISNNNVNTLESIDDVKSINISNYLQNTAASDEIQHRQLGTYTDANGNKYSVNDVWF